MIRFLIPLAICVLMTIMSCSKQQPAPSQSEEVHVSDTPITADPAGEGGTITVQYLNTLLEDSASLQLLDVRTPEEVAGGKIINDALHINLHDEDFEQQLQQLDQDKTYYVYCKLGGRSSKAQTIMLAQGFKNVINVEGGITAWEDSGYPLR